MRNAVIITGNKYPNGDAGALRQHSMAKMLQELGYHVMIYGMGPSTNKAITKNDGIEYMSMRGNRLSKLTRITDRITWGFQALYDMERRFETVDVILVVDDNPFLFKAIEKRKKRLSCTLIHDSVEWYSPEEFKLGKLDIQYILKNYINTKMVNKNWNIIAISEYLYNWFKEKANKVVLIPVITEIENTTNALTVVEKSEKKVFVYAGAPGKKDFLKEIISGFSLLNKEVLEKIELHIIGVNKEQLIDACGVDVSDIKKLSHSLYIHGKVPHEDAERWVRKADYTLLLRDPNLRYAKAGFPTKIVESLKLGTPPMCNLSSDLKNYLYDKKNAVFIMGFDAEAVKEAVENSFSISKTEHMKMRKCARETAEKFFAYSNYMTMLEYLLQ